MGQRLLGSAVAAVLVANVAIWYGQWILAGMLLAVGCTAAIAGALLMLKAKRF